MNRTIVLVASLAAFSLSACDNKPATTEAAAENSAPAAEDVASDPVDVGCAAPEIAGEKFIMTCGAQKDPRDLAITLSGTLYGEYEVLPTSLEIAAAGKPEQSFALENAQVSKDRLQEAGIALVDINFDGVTDLQVWTVQGNVNFGFEYFLYDTETKTFVATPVGAQLFGEIEFDAATKTIRTSARASCCEWEVDTYAWEGTNLVRKSHEVIQNDGEPDEDAAGEGSVKPE